jgi:hypothetical protein
MSERHEQGTRQGRAHLKVHERAQIESIFVEGLGLQGLVEQSRRLVQLPFVDMRLTCEAAKTGQA